MHNNPIRNRHDLAWNQPERDENFETMRKVGLIKCDSGFTFHKHLNSRLQSCCLDKDFVEDLEFRSNIWHFDGLVGGLEGKHSLEAT